MANAVSPPTQYRELTKKICLLGDPSVGKTSLIRRFVTDEFDDKYLSTIGTKVSKKQMLVQVPAKQLSVKLTLMIWDVAGQQEYRMFHKMYLKGVEGAFSVCDITTRSTFDTMRKNVNLIHSEAGDIPIVFIMNKSDLTEQAQVRPDEINETEHLRKIPTFQTSAKSGLNVEKAFQTIAELMTNRWLGLPT